MSAVRKPTAVLEANGAFTRNPKRARARRYEPDTGRGVGPAPEYLTSEQGKAWDDIVSACAPGVFQSSDTVFLAAMSAMVAQFREDPVGFGISRYQIFLTMLTRAGMTPSDRSRVAVPPAPSDDGKKTGLASFKR